MTHSLAQRPPATLTPWKARTWPFSPPVQLKVLIISAFMFSIYGMYVKNSHYTDRLDMLSGLFGYCRHMYVATFQVSPLSSFDRLQYAKTEEEGPFYHMNDASVHLGKQMGQGSLIEIRSLRSYLEVSAPSEKCAAPGSKQRTCA